MSHELRTPLNSIIGFSKVLLNRLDGDLTERQEAYVRSVHNTSRHLLELITGILDFSRIGVRQVRDAPGEGGPARLVRSASSRRSRWCAQARQAREGGAGGVAALEADRTQDQAGDAEPRCPTRSSSRRRTRVGEVRTRETVVVHVSWWSTPASASGGQHQYACSSRSSGSTTRWPSRRGGRASGWPSAGSSSRSQGGPHLGGEPREPGLDVPFHAAASSGS